MGLPLQVAIPATAAAGTSAVLAEIGEVPVNEATDSNVVRAVFTPQTAQAAQGATNFGVLQVRDTTKANAVVASVSLGTTALVAETGVALTLAGVGVAGGDNLDVFLVQAGTGGACPAGELTLELN
jgi:hypothetical protein